MKTGRGSNKLQESNKRRVHHAKFKINAGASNQENTVIISCSQQLITYKLKGGDS